MGPGHQKSRRWVVDVSLCASCPVGMSVRYNRGQSLGEQGGGAKIFIPCFDSKKLRKGRVAEALFYSLIYLYVLVNVCNFTVCVQFVLINMALCVACRSLREVHLCFCVLQRE